MSLVVAFSATAQAIKPPPRIFGLYSERVPVCFYAGPNREFECEGETADRILVIPTARNGVWLEVNLLFHNGHSCEFEGNGEWKNDHLLVEKFDAEACELRVYFKGGKAVLADDGRCREKYCGASGQFDGVSLRKRGSM